MSDLTWLTEPVTIHFKEDGIPSLRRGELTEESKQAILAKLDEAIPKKKKVNAGDFSYNREMAKQFNQAVEQIREALGL